VIYFGESYLFCVEKSSILCVTKLRTDTIFEQACSVKKNYELNVDPWDQNFFGSKKYQNQKFILIEFGDFFFFYFLYMTFFFSESQIKIVPEIFNSVRYLKKQFLDLKNVKESILVVFRAEGESFAPQNGIRFFMKCILIIQACSKWE